MLINFFIAISLGLVFCFIFRKLSKDIGLVDIPDGVRKTHTGKIPLGGGLSICFTYFICSLIFVELHVCSQSSLKQVHPESFSKKI